MTSDGQWTSLWLRRERDEPLKTVRGMLSKYLRTCPLSSSQSVATTSVTLHHLYHVGTVSQSYVHVSYNVVFISTKFSFDVKTIFVLLCTSLWPIQPFQWTLQKWVSHHKMKHNEGCYTLDPCPAEPLVKLQQIVAEMAQVRGKVHGYTGHASLPRTWHLTRNCYSLLTPLPSPRYPSFSTMHPAHTALIQRRNSRKKKAALKNIFSQLTYISILGAATTLIYMLLS